MVNGDQLWSSRFPLPAGGNCVARVRAHFHHWGDEDRLELELFVAQWPFNSSVEKVEEASVVSSLEWFPRGYWTATLFSHEQYCDKITAPKLLSNAHMMRIGGVGR